MGILGLGPRHEVSGTHGNGDDKMRSFATEADIWNKLGKQDPLWAILSDPRKKGNRWSLGEFFAVGETEIDGFVKQLDALEQTVGRERCLDFGCGVGRLTRPLANHFGESYGVDVADTMIERAREFHKGVKNIQFYINRNDNLSLFPDNHFDVIYSHIVLQHISPEHAIRYVAEFVRILKPGGVAVFQIPARQIEADEFPNFDISIELVDGPKSITAGSRATFTLRVTNNMSKTLESVESHAFRIGNHWYDAAGIEAIRDDGRTAIDPGLKPGESRQITIEVTAPRETGDFSIGFDGVLEAWLWFDAGHDKIQKHKLTVNGPAALQTKRTSRPFVNLASKLASQFLRLSQDEDAQPVDFMMYAVPRNEVTSTVERCGGKILNVAKDGSAGVHWESFFYWVSK